MPYCTHPVSLRDRTDPTLDKTVRCGQCLACRIQIRRTKIGQQKAERIIRGTCLFITPTYAPEHMPRINYSDHGPIKGAATIDPMGLRRFIERLRLSLKRNFGIKKVSYLAIGEYGELAREETPNGRPHYHINLFGPEILEHSEVTEEIESQWDKGICEVQIADGGNFDYVAQYTAKKLVKLPREDGSHPAFVRFSKSPGLGYALAESLTKALDKSIKQKKLQRLATKIAPHATHETNPREIVKAADLEKTPTDAELIAALQMADFLIGEWRVEGKRYPIPRRMLDQIEENLGLTHDQSKYIRQIKSQMYRDITAAELRSVTPGDAAPIDEFVIANRQKEKARKGLEKQRRKSWAKRRDSQI